MIARLLMLVTMAIVVAPGSLAAQGADTISARSLRRGDAAIVAYARDARLVQLAGAIIRVGADSLVVERCRVPRACDPYALPAHAVAELYVDRGGGRSVGRALAGGVLGLAGGAVLGALVGVRGCNPDDPCLGAIVYGIGAGALGFGVGVAVGAAPQRRWVRVTDYPPPR